MESIVRPNPRETYEREEDTMPLWAKILYRYGVPSVIALGLVWLIGTRILATMERIEQSQQRHEMSTQFYLRQICITGAAAAGQPSGLCNPWEDRHQ